MCQNIFVFSTEMKQGTIWLEFGRGDPHRLRCLCTTLRGHRCSSICKQTRGRQQATFRRHPGGTQEAPKAPRRHPGGQRCLGGKMCQNICVFSAKVARPTIPLQRGEGDHHRLRCLCRKVDRRRYAPDPAEETTIPKTSRQNPYSRSCLGGNIYSGSQKFGIQT